MISLPVFFAVLIRGGWRARVWFAREGTYPVAVNALGLSRPESVAMKLLYVTCGRVLGR
jgi:hypothetical protein